MKKILNPLVFLFLFGVCSLNSAAQAPSEELPLQAITDLSSAVQSNLAELLHEKFQERAYLGVKSVQHDRGARIVEVVSNSPAEKAGLKVGDVITAVDDKTIDGPETLGNVIGAMKPEQSVKISYLRDEAKGEVTVTLAEYSDTSPERYFWFKLPDQGWQQGRPFRMPNPYGKFFNFGDSLMYTAPPPKLGIQIQETEDNKGVNVTNVTPGMPADQAGVKEGDLIVEINGNAVNNVSDAQNVIQRQAKEYKLRLVRNKKSMNITVTVPRTLRKADL